MSVILTVLGCGDSGGVPMIGNHWGLCDPLEPRNRRTRSSVVVRSETTTLLIDTGPDLRAQANREGLGKIDAIFYTHMHSDHTMGIDEIRAQNKRLGFITTPVYSTKETLDDITKRFDYMFVQQHKIYPTVLEAHVVEPAQYTKPMTIGDIEFTPFIQDHGTCETLGFRFGSVGYSTDMVNMPPESFEVLKGIKTWIVDAAGYKMERNLVHARLQDVYRFNEIIGAEQVYLSHLPAGIDYKTLQSETPAGYDPAYDGLELVC